MDVTRRGWIVAVASGIFGLAATSALAQGNGRGRGHDKGDDDDHDDHAHDDHYYRDDDRRAAKAWYDDHQNHLPPGLAKRDQLPPGLEKQLVVRGHLPPGLQKKIEPAPVELVRELPPPPPDCEHVIIGGHIVLINRKTFMVMDVMHLEIR